ncbi:CoA transferase [Hwanghaeella sp.]|uniref:CoA transferase n=1 Tax=Hwanghaeella sp. TaxID=2605943 RepID=UPI003CCBDCD6
MQDLWSAAGLPTRALSRVRLIGTEPVLPSSFRVGTAAQSAIALTGLAASEIDRLRTGREQAVTVDILHAALEFRSERLLRIDGGNAPELWDPIAGTYQCGDGRWVRIHTNFEHHRDGVLEILGCANDREAVAAALKTWQAEAFETEATDRELVVAMMRTPEEWAAHPHAAVLARQPVISIEKIGEAKPTPLPPQDAGDRPLSSLRALDLTRIIAGPTGGRALAAHGATVMRIGSPNLPVVPVLVMETGRGKLAVHLDLDTTAGKAGLERLLRDTDVFIQGYRPGGLAERGFGPEEAAERRPGLVYVSLSAYGDEGPWGGKRGFDSLVQTATGINAAEAQAAGSDLPKALPCQALDHASGYFIAFGAMAALMRRAEEGGSWHVKVSLARTGQWLRDLGRLDGGLSCPEPSEAQIRPFLTVSDSGFGKLTHVTHAARLSETPPRWDLPSVPVGTHLPVWPG